LLDNNSYISPLIELGKNVNSFGELSNVTEKNSSSSYPLFSSLEVFYLNSSFLSSFQINKFFFRNNAKINIA